MHRQFRKPLVVMAPKSLLRHPACRSYLYEFDNIPDETYIEGVRFKRLIMDKHETDRSPRPTPHPDTQRLVLCTGKVFYDLDAMRDELGLGNKVRPRGGLVDTCLRVCVPARLLAYLFAGPPYELLACLFVYGLA